ncbi:MAG: hypothetical protein U0V04_07270 [Spirosomataceae bacterium]|jgi:hypothetical protein
MDKTEIVILSLGLLMVIAIMVFQLWKSRPVKPRKWVLNILFWLSLVILVFPIKWKADQNQRKILVHDKTLSQDFLNHLKDSLKVDNLLSVNSIQKNKVSDLLKNYDEIILSGTNFEPSFLAALSGKKILYFPFFEKKTISDLHWKGNLHQFENQEITGKIYSKSAGNLTVKYGDTILDSMKISKENQVFSLNFPAFGIGRNKVELYLEGKPVAKVNFFTKKLPQLSIKILAENPDFEMKTLADWLGKQGHKVEMVSKVSKSDYSVLEINKKSSQKTDIMIVSPENLQNKELKSFGVLVMNLENPPVEINKINNVFGEKFRIKRISNASEISLKNGAFQHPFIFEKSDFYLQENEGILAVSPEKLAVSLYSETYPLMLAGDSLEYDKIWASALHALIPDQKNNLIIEAPVLQKHPQEIVINKPEKLNETNILAGDSISFQANGQGDFSGNMLFINPGWQSLNDSIEIFVENGQLPYQKASIISNILKNNNLIYLSKNETESYEEISEVWKWFLVILLFTLLWLEPKF